MLATVRYPVSDSFVPEALVYFSDVPVALVKFSPLMVEELTYSWELEAMPVTVRAVPAPVTARVPIVELGVLNSVEEATPVL